MKEKIFKEKQLKKTLVESIELPNGEVGAVLINNKNEIERGVKIDEGGQPILTDQERSQLMDEQKKFKTDNPLNAHNMAVKEQAENNGAANGTNGNGNNEVQENNKE